MCKKQVHPLQEKQSYCMVKALPRGPIDTQICVPHFCRFYREKKRPVSEKAPVSTCFHQRLDSFQNCARVAQMCARVAENCARVAVMISVQFDFLARSLVPNQKAPIHKQTSDLQKMLGTHICVRIGPLGRAYQHDRNPLPSPKLIRSL